MQFNEEKNPLFTEMNPEEAARVSGGRRINFDLNTYLFTLGLGIVLHKSGMISNVAEFAWDYYSHLVGYKRLFSIRKYPFLRLW